jgi:DNA-binding transcriptional LysR family regulator
MSDVDLRLYRAAVYVAEELSFSRAADRLRITQPGLTKQIQELELRLKIQVFDRDQQKVQVTEAGAAFLAEARLILLYEKRAIEAARAAAEGAEAILNIGRSPYIDPYLSAIALSIHLPYHPKLRLHSVSDNSPQLTKMVLNGELDVAVLAEGAKSKQLSSFVLARSPLYLLFGAESSLAHHESVRISQMNGMPWILFSKPVHTYLYEAFMERAASVNSAPKELHHVTTAEQAAQLVRTTGGVAVLTKLGAWRVAVRGMTMRPLREPDIEVRTVLTSRLDANRLVAGFLQAMMRKVEAMKAGHDRTLTRAG